MINKAYYLHIENKYRYKKARVMVEACSASTWSNMCTFEAFLFSATNVNVMT